MKVAIQMNARWQPLYDDETKNM